MAWTWALATLVATSMFVWVAIPVVLIMPFKPQTPLGVALSFELRQKAALVTLLGAILLFALLVRLARNATRWWQWPPLVLLAAIGAFPTWFARQNHFEWMFNPLPDPTYAPATLVDFVDDRDMVVAVEIGGECRGLARAPDGVSPHRGRQGRRCARRQHLLNAVSHRSGLGADDRRAGVGFPALGDQQPELHHARRADGLVVAAGDGRGHPRPAQGAAAGGGRARRGLVRHLEGRAAGRPRAPRGSEAEGRLRVRGLGAPDEARPHGHAGGDG